MQHQKHIYEKHIEIFFKQISAGSFQVYGWTKTKIEMKTNMNGQFFQDIIDGLKSKPKYIPSKYFYDAEGDRLFQKIMKLEEYYLTRCEYEILDNNKSKILNLFMENARGFSLIEFGAGDAYKTKLILHHFTDKNVDFIYSPVDISGNILKTLQNNLATEIPGLRVETVEADYFEALDIITKKNCDKKVVLFLGSNIGNFTYDECLAFLTSVRKKLNKGDIFLIGFDLQKDPQVILNAYNDKSDVTKSFNINLLKRINREMGANFNPEKFGHYPTYDPATGEAKSFLISKFKQEVQLNGEDNQISFDEGECIYTETSRKYTLKQIDELAGMSGFEVKKNLFDSKQYYVDSVWYVV